MQRQEGEFIIISCDFCGTDWDEVLPMVEGHKGSVLCLACLEKALAQLSTGDAFDCCMCLQNKPATKPRWRHPDPAQSPGLNPDATACESCLRQAAQAFDKDPDIDWSKPE